MRGRIVLIDGIAHKAVLAKTDGGRYTKLCDPSLGDNLHMVRDKEITCEECLGKIPEKRRMGQRPVKPMGREAKWWKQQELRLQLKKMMQ